MWLVGWVQNKVTQKNKKKQIKLTNKDFLSVRSSWSLREISLKY